MNNKNKVILIIFFSLIVFISSFSINEKFSYLEVPQKLIIKEASISLKGYKNIVSYLPKNYSKSGNVDYTSYIQNALDNETQIIMPNFPVLVNSGGLSVRSNTSIIFQTNSNIIIQPNNKTNYGIINIINESNVNLYNVKVTGDKYKHLGNTGEWGMGLNIIGSKNIKIINPNVTQCWGDGIYIGTRGILPENITISGGIVDDNRRNGISIISGRDITIENIVLSNTNGTLPMAGIDLEPNKANEQLDNIVLKNVTTFNNSQDGFLIYLFKLLSVNKSKVSISLIDCKDYFSSNAISIPGLRNDYDKNIQRLDGYINLTNFKSFMSNSAFKRSSGNYVYTPKINVNNIQVYSKEERSSSKERDVIAWMRSKKFLIDK